MTRIEKMTDIGVIHVENFRSTKNMLVSSYKLDMAFCRKQIVLSLVCSETFNSCGSETC